MLELSAHEPLRLTVEPFNASAFEFGARGAGGPDLALRSPGLPAEFSVDPLMREFGYVKGPGFRAWVDPALQGSEVERAARGNGGYAEFSVVPEAARLRGSELLRLTHSETELTARAPESLKLEQAPAFVEPPVAHSDALPATRTEPAAAADAPLLPAPQKMENAVVHVVPIDRGIEQWRTAPQKMENAVVHAAQSEATKAATIEKAELPAFNRIWSAQQIVDWMNKGGKISKIKLMKQIPAGKYDEVKALLKDAERVAAE